MQSTIAFDSREADTDKAPAKDVTKAASKQEKTFKQSSLEKLGEFKNSGKSDTISFPGKL